MRRKCHVESRRKIEGQCIIQKARSCVSHTLTVDRWYCFSDFSAVEAGGHSPPSSTHLRYYMDEYSDVKGLFQ
jgi:hypothetical protein